jgi:hypothetical protein
MSFLWIVTVASLLAAVVAVVQGRRTARRLEQLSQMYWELKYQHGELRVQLQRLTGEAPPASQPPAAPAARPPDGFIPLASLKR